MLSKEVKFMIAAVEDRGPYGERFIVMIVQSGLMEQEAIAACKEMNWQIQHQGKTLQLCIMREDQK